MSETFDPKLRDLLRKIIRRSGQKLSSGALIREFQKDTVNASILRQFADIVKNDSLALNLFEVDTETKVHNLAEQKPEQWLINYLEKYLVKFTFYKEIHNAAKQLNNSTSIKTTPDEVTNSNISDILKKVKAATDGYQSHSHTNNNNQVANVDTKNVQEFSVDEKRPHNLWYFNRLTFDNLPVGTRITNCAALPISNQEQLIIDDLLYLFIGIPGDYITPQFTQESENGFASIPFKISEQIDVSLRNIVQDILPMASHFSIVQKFAQWSSKVKNQILQALGEVLQNILNDYRVSVCQLETEQSNGTLNLHKLLYLTRPNMQTLQILADIVAKMSKSDLMGGNILSMLYDEITMQIGDSKAQKMLIELTEQASVPYIEMLELWILKGVIIDRFEQFFVIDHGKELGNEQCLYLENFDTTHYWENRYAIVPERIPRFLEIDADIILRTGKYLNVIRQCGKQIIPPSGIRKLEFSATKQHHSVFIKQAYHNASKTLLNLLITENNLMGHISSVKRYFLLQQGDLITQFMDASEDELRKHVDKVTPVKLDNLLQLIVRLSSAKYDSCLEHLHCDLFTMDLLKQMSKIYVAGNYDLMTSRTNDDLESVASASAAIDDSGNLNLSGMECFAFKYSVNWPISIVLNQWALTQYQMLFRLLFYCKHVDRQLCKVWIENSKAKLENDVVEWRMAFALRQRMLNAIQHLEYYMMIEVIEPNWHIFMEKMKTVHDIDDVIMIHQDFLYVCLQNCMLHYPDLLQSLMNICGICLKFCKNIRNQMTCSAEVIQWKLDIESIDAEFNTLLVDFIKSLGEQSSETTSTAKFVNLVCRLNFNSFYN